MSTQEKAATQETEQQVDGGNWKIWLRCGAFVAMVSAVAVVTATVVMIGGSEPANACLLGVPFR